MVDLDQLEKAHTDAAWSNFEERGDLSKDIADLLDAVPGLIAELRALRARVAELERDLDACRVELLEARHTVGEAWFAGGVSLAEAIERKCRALEDEVEGWQLAARGWP